MKEYLIKTKEDIEIFLKEEIVNTNTAKEILGCSRQYKHELYKKEKLNPVMILEKDKLFLKEDVLKFKKK
jgi:hypothetical protein